MNGPADYERVLRDDDWLRRMARRLVHDPERAEDLVQETWLASVRGQRKERSWLFGTLRNLVRQSSRAGRRREDHESRRPVTGSAPPTDEVVADLALRSRVTEELLGLEEPLRTTLWLRFVKDQKLAAIARRTGVSVPTVHERLARGLAQLRCRLDRAHGGDRAAWAGLLLPLIDPVGTIAAATTLATGIAMGTATKITACTLVLAGATYLWLDDRVERRPVAALTPEKVEAQAPAPVEPEIVQEASAPERQDVAQAEDRGFVASSEVTMLACRIIDCAGVPVPGARIGARGAEVASDPAGAFDWPASDDVPELYCIDPEWFTVLPGIEKGGERLVVVAPRVELAGQVVDPDGVPLGEARLHFTVRSSLYRTLGLTLPFGTSYPVHEVRTDEQGAFSMDVGGASSHLVLNVARIGYESAEVELPSLDDRSMLIELEATGQITLQGIVLDRHGAPLPGAFVAAGRERVTSDENGEFRLPWKLQGAGSFHVEDGIWRPIGDTSFLTALKPGHRPLRVAVEDLDVDARIVLQLAGEPLTLRGRVVDGDGQGRAGVVVWLSDLTHFASEEVRYNDVTTTSDLEVELLNREADRRGVVTGEDGEFELPGLMDRPYKVWVHGPHSAEVAGPFSHYPGEEEVVLVFPTDPSIRRVAGRMRDSSGAPVVGVAIRPKRRDLSVNPPLGGEGGGWTRTDEEGRFEYERLWTRDVWLELQHPSFIFESVELSDHPDLEEMDVVLPVLCEAVVAVADPDLADHVRFLDSDGEAVDALVSHGSLISVQPAVKLVDGASPVMSVLDRAEFVVLEKEGVEVGRRRIELRPDERAEVSF